MDKRLELVKNKLAEISMMGNITDYTPYAQQLIEELAKADRLDRPETFICPWCEKEKPISSKCSKGYCRACSSYDF